MLNNMLLNNQQIMEEMKKEIKIFIETNENENMTTQNLWDSVKAVFIGRTDVEAETPILWPRDAKSWLIWKDPDAGKGWRWEGTGTTEGERVGWHHWLNGHESEQAPGACDGQGRLVCCSPCGHKELDTTERLNWTELNALTKTKLHTT